MKNRVKISIDGKSFTLVGEETEEHMRQVATYIDQKMAEIRQKAVAVTLDSSLAYVLTSINVADDYFKEKAYTAELEGRLSGMTARAKELAARLEEAERAAEESGCPQQADRGDDCQASTHHNHTHKGATTHCRWLRGQPRTTPLASGERVY